MANLALVDDHILLRTGLAELVRNLGHQVILEASHGEELIEKLEIAALPEVVLMDINMPVKDGYETTLWLKKNHPKIKVLALSMYDSEASVIRMLKNGAKGYILKDSDPAELQTAIQTLVERGFYYSELVTGDILSSALHPDADSDHPSHRLNEREITFLQLACSELTYKEIAEKMFISPRTVDGYRDSLFEKLNVKTRVGLVLFAIRQKLVDFYNE